MEVVYTDRHHDLVAACKKGERKAQYELYRLYSKAMFNVSMRIVNDEGEAADVLQEAFLDAFVRIADFRQETTFGLWIKQIVINRSISQLRKRKLEWVSLQNEIHDIAEEQASDEQTVKLELEKVHRGIQQLADGYRVVLSLYLLEGYDHEEISEILGISKNTSRTQFMRAKRKLLDILKVQKQ